MKKLVLSLVAVLMSVICALPSYAALNENESWSFYVYMVDSDESLPYNNKVRMEISNSTFSSNMSFYCESSRNTDLNNFLNFCKKNFDSDHKILLIIGKGEGVYGIKQNTYENLSLSDIKQALSMNFISDLESPELDIVMYDASLMATVEMGDILKGYARYLIAPESVAYDVNGFYLSFLSEFSKVTDKSSEKLSHIILDTYAKCVDDHMSRGAVITSALSMLDPIFLSDAYSSYKTLVKNMLKKISENNMMLSHISYQSKLAVPMGETLIEYKHNLVDAVDFMNKLKVYYPVDVAKVKKCLSKALLYKVNSPFMEITCGASIYFPMFTFDGHEKYMSDYIDNIACSDYIKALYDYKMTGKIDSSLKSNLKKDGINKIQELDFDALNRLKESIVEYKENDLNFIVKPKKEIKELMQDVRMVMYKRVAGNLVLYNQDSFSEPDKYNNIVTKYGGTWLKLNGYPLKLDLLADNNVFTEYAADIKLNDELKKLYIVYENNSHKIVGVDQNSLRADAFGTNVSMLRNNDRLAIVRHVINPKLNKRAEDLFPEFRYKSDMSLSEEIMEDGEYTCELQFEDLRGNTHEGLGMLFSIMDGKISRVVSEYDLFRVAGKAKSMLFENNN